MSIKRILFLCFVASTLVACSYNSKISSYKVFADRGPYHKPFVFLNSNNDWSYFTKNMAMHLDSMLTNRGLVAKVIQQQSLESTISTDADVYDVKGFGPDLIVVIRPTEGVKRNGMLQYLSLEITAYSMGDTNPIWTARITANTQLLLALDNFDAIIEISHLIVNQLAKDNLLTYSAHVR